MKSIYFAGVVLASLALTGCGGGGGGTPSAGSGSGSGTGSGSPVGQAAIQSKQMAANGLSEQVSYSFGTSNIAATNPTVLTIDASGNLYGISGPVSAGNGATNQGTLYKISTDGTSNVLYTFLLNIPTTNNTLNSGFATNASVPNSSLLIDSQGNIYGTAATNGAYLNAGLVYRLSASGQFSVVYNLPQTLGNEPGPTSSLVQDSSGNIYGTTQYGGINNLGSIFRIDANGIGSTLYSFAGGATDGAQPAGGLIIGGDGALYGTTTLGGQFSSGTAFRISTYGQMTLLHSFGAQTDATHRDGAYPADPLIQDQYGNLYGVTQAGGLGVGNSQGQNVFGGTVYKIAPDGTYTSIYQFVPSSADGILPMGPVAIDNEGNIYGITKFGGAAGGISGNGIFFKITPDGTETVGYQFGLVANDGAQPSTGLSCDGAGNLYAATMFGGSVGQGAIIKISGPAANCGTAGTVSQPTQQPVNSSISPQSQNATVLDDVQTTIGFTVTTTGAVNSNYIPVVNFNSAVFASASFTFPAPGQVAVTLTTLSALQPGSLQGQVSFQYCTDNTCATSLPGSQQVFNYNLTVQLDSWGQYQRNAAHTGYAPVTLNSANFAPAWNWNAASSLINSAVSGNGNIYFSTDYCCQSNAVYALDQASGNVVWSYASNSLTASSPPGFSNNTVWFEATNTIQNMISTQMVELDSATGTVLGSYNGGYGAELAPTILGGQVYSGGVTAISATALTKNWQVHDDFAEESPAADINYVYHYDGLALDIYFANSGLLVESIPDLNSTRSCCYINAGKYIGVPVLDGNGNVIILSGKTDISIVGVSTWGYNSRPITSFSVRRQNVNWSTSATYMTQPALANGVIYAGTGTSVSFDAIDAQTGQVNWSWSPTNGDTSFYRNVVVTNNLAFASTDKGVYAIDLNTHQSVWFYPYPGAIALTEQGYLIISVGAQYSDGTIQVVKLV